MLPEVSHQAARQNQTCFGKKTAFLSVKIRHINKYVNNVPT